MRVEELDIGPKQCVCCQWLLAVLYLAEDSVKFLNIVDLKDVESSLLTLLILPVPLLCFDFADAYHFAFDGIVDQECFIIACEAIAICNERL